jgi:hypothetical protein
MTTGFKRWLCWLLAPVLLFLPLLWITRLNFLGNSDALFYSNILSMTSDALRRGEIFPRWLPEANAGFGSPVMMFYAPLAYLVTAIVNLPFAWLHPDIGTQLVIGMYASLVVSGYTAFLWLKRSFAHRIAFICSLLFVLLPYKLIYIYLHINLAQLWALALLPLWMIAAEEILKGCRRAIGAYALVFAAVYYTHPLTLIAFGAVPTCYVLWFGRKAFTAGLSRLALAHVLAVLLCCMQALSGHADLVWIHAERFFEGNYSWKNNFFHVDVVLCAYYGIIAMLVGFAVWRIPAIRHSKVAQPGIFWIAVLAVVLFLTQRVSTWVWLMFPPLQYLQFPAARLHAPALMAVVYLIGIWLSCYKEMMPLGGMAYRRATLALLIVFFTATTAWRVYKVESDPKEASDSYLGQGRASKIISTPVPMYETRWGCIDAGKAFDLYKQGKVPAPVAFTSGHGMISQLHWEPSARIAFIADIASGGAGLAVRQCYIPLWRAKDGKERDIPLLAEKPDGVIALTLPEGRQQVEITLQSSGEEILSRWISLLALIGCVMLLGLKRKDGSQVGPPADDFS